MADYFDKGFCVRRPSWHVKETLLEDYPEDWDAARLAAGLMWEPAKTSALMAAGGEDGWDDVYTPRIVYRGDETPAGALYVRDATTDGARIFLVPQVDRQAIVRDDTGALLATPTGSFELIYHSQMGELLDAYTEAWRKAGATLKFETAGSVRGGAMVWALVFLDEPYTIPGDDSATYPYAALLNAHDGSGACKLLPTEVRVVCWNTWNAASAAGDRTGHQVIIRHVGNMAERIETAKEGLATMRDDAKEWQILAADLASINVSDAVVQQFLDEFIPIPENATERTRAARADKQAAFRKLYTESPTQTAITGTAYGLVQAAGEYLDHLRPFRSADTYLARTILSNEPIKAGTIRLVRELVSSAN